MSVMKSWLLSTQKQISKKKATKS